MINPITFIIIFTGCISIIAYAINNIKNIKNRKIPKKEQRRINKIKRAKKKYGKDYIKN